MKNKIVITFIVVVIIALIFDNNIESNESEHEVFATKASYGKIVDSILASGNLVFNTQVQIRSEVTGRVVKVFVKEGERVKKGDILMQLDTDAFNAEVERLKALVRANHIEIKRAKTSLLNYERQLKRQQKLYEAGLTQQETYDNISNNRDLALIEIEATKESLNQSKASLSIAEDKLRKSVFLAPMSGLVASVDIKEGETVIAGTTNIIGSDLMLLADPSAILAELRVDETDIASIELGQSADIFAAAYPNTPFKGKVISIGEAAKTHESSHGLSFKVKVLLEPTEKRLYAGMSSRAEIATSTGENGFKLPIEAIQKRANDHYVWLLDIDGTVKKQPVKLGVSSDIEQAVLEGITSESTVVIGPERVLHSLNEGDSVEVMIVSDYKNSEGNV